VRISKRLGYICLAVVAVAAVLILVKALVPLIVLALVGAPALYQFLAVRRTYVVVGEGWWLTRVEAWGRGRWSTFEALKSVRRRFGANDMPYLEFRSATARGRFGADMSGPVAHGLASQALASAAEIDDEARLILLSWLGDTEAAPARSRAATSNRSAARGRRRRTGGWQFALSGTMLAASGPFVFLHGWHDVRIHNDPDAVRVVARVDHVQRQCGRGGCSWWSYGHYDVAGQLEDEVEVAKDRSSPARDPQTILVNPAHPRDVVNVDESPNAFLALGIAALAAGVLFLVLWARPMTRRLSDNPASKT
jgi:hypothetical protein